MKKISDFTEKLLLDPFLSKKTLLDDKADLIFNKNLQLQKASYKDSMKSAIKSTLKRVARIDETLAIAELIISANSSKPEKTPEELASEYALNSRFNCLSVNTKIRYNKIFYILSNQKEIEKTLKKNYIIVTNGNESRVVWTSDSELNSIVKPLLKDIEKGAAPVLFALFSEVLENAYPYYLLNRAEFDDDYLAKYLSLLDVKKEDIKTLDEILIQDVMYILLGKFSVDNQKFLIEEIKDFTKRIAIDNRCNFRKNISNWKKITDQSNLTEKKKKIINPSSRLSQRSYANSSLHLELNECFMTSEN